MTDTQSISTTSKTIVKKKKPNDLVWFWANDCRYSVILDRVAALGWALIEDEKKESRCNVFWIDVSTINERFRTILPWQIINHFPGMPNIARKNRMGQNLNSMAKVFPKEYSYYPRTWVLPAELSEFRLQFDNAGNSIGNKIYIIKPDAGCQGRGISLVRHFDQVPQLDNVVAQLYIKKPLLIEGFKFDLRLYIFVTSIRPLRMYLFNDGLVRICTEEYVKPSKQNLSMMCMHLTNYAVNKKNDKFQQAQGAEDEGGTKRSLDWFMNWIRSEYGESKANWLWKRFGVLAVRTLLSILPTLARDYDYHFKGFNNVPVNPPPNLSLYSTQAPPQHPNERSSHRSNNSLRSARNRSNGRVKSSRANMTNSDGDQDEDEGDHDEDDGDRNYYNSNTENTSNLENEETEQSEEESKPISGEENEEGSGVCENWRGSRCFEVLGIDVMVDSQLRPWLIEFNHLPSFGTDSPLDLDIKGRLMEEVFRVLNARPDDEQMYSLYHKIEAERRLLSDRNAAAAAKLKEKLEKEKKEEAERIGRERWSKRRSEAMREKEKQREAAEAAAAAKAEMVTITRERERNLQHERLLKQQNQEDTPVSPERLQEITKVLSRIYEIYCPQKLNKIDKLLAKYACREEEFVAFVFGKYDVPYELMPSFLNDEALPVVPPSASTSTSGSKPTENTEEAMNDGATSTTSAAATTTENLNNSMDHEPKEDPATQTSRTHPPSVSASAASESEKNESTSSSRPPRVREPAVKKNRSLSPPKKKLTSVWKGAPEDDEALRTEIIAQYVPTPDNKFLLFEEENLPNFTRIFPLLPTKSDDKNQGDDELEGIAEGAEGGDGDGDDEKGDDEKGGGGGGGSTGTGGRKQKSNNEGPDTTSVTEKEEPSPPSQTSEKKSLQQIYEDILFYVFLQDRRRTLRKSCPLASNTSTNRSKSFERPSDNSKEKDSLPQLNEPTSARKKSAQGGRQQHGWRPPQPREKKDSQPKATSTYQSEIANKLSRGLSSLANQTEETKPIRSSNRVIVSAKHRLYTNTATSSASAAGYVYSHYLNPNGGVPSNGSSYSQYGQPQDGGGGGGGGGNGAGVGGNSNGYDNSVWSGRGGGGAGGIMSGDYDNYDVMNGNQHLLQQQSTASMASVGSGGPNRNVTVAKLTATTVKQKTFMFDSKVPANTAFGESSTSFGGYVRSQGR